MDMYDLTDGVDITELVEDHEITMGLRDEICKLRAENETLKFTIKTMQQLRDAMEKNNVGNK